MIVLAVDPGTVRCGLATSDPLGILATPIGFLPVGDGSDLAQRIVDKAGELEAATIIIGYPLQTDGAEGPRAKAVSRLADQIRALTDAQVELVDERYTTIEARELLRQAGHSSRKQKARVDSAAAAVLLQSWLDSRGPA
ncbi:MAG: Holliday junction resolvase RuvX [Deltaproteobacteria bacterium]|nr:Holliday junction resolvase RuvX [Deltaproteobacteria bacterium]